MYTVPFPAELYRFGCKRAIITWEVLCLYAAQNGFSLNDISLTNAHLTEDGKKANELPEDWGARLGVEPSGAARTRRWGLRCLLNRGLVRGDWGALPRQKAHVKTCDIIDLIHLGQRCDCADAFTSGDIGLTVGLLKHSTFPQVQRTVPIDVRGLGRLHPRELGKGTTLRQLVGPTLPAYTGALYGYLWWRRHSLSANEPLTLEHVRDFVAWRDHDQQCCATADKPPTSARAAAATSDAFDALQDLGVLELRQRQITFLPVLGGGEPPLRPWLRLRRTSQGLADRLDGIAEQLGWSAAERDWLATKLEALLVSGTMPDELATQVDALQKHYRHVQSWTRQNSEHFLHDLRQRLDWERRRTPVRLSEVKHVTAHGTVAGTPELLRETMNLTLPLGSLSLLREPLRLCVQRNDPAALVLVSLRDVANPELPLTAWTKGKKDAMAQGTALRSALLPLASATPDARFLSLWVGATRPTGVAIWLEMP